MSQLGEVGIVCLLCFVYRGKVIFHFDRKNTSFWKINIEKILPCTDKVIYHAGRKRECLSLEAQTQSEYCLR